MYLARFTKAISLILCGGLTLDGSQMPTKLLDQSPQRGRVGRK